MSMFRTDEGRQVADVLTKLLSDIPHALFADVEQGLWPENLWRSVEEAGLPLALVPEAAGGFGLPLEDGLALLQLSAESVVPLPLAETMVANLLAARAGLPVIPGPLTFAAGDFRIMRDGSLQSLSGHAERVPWGRHASVLVLASSPQGSKLVRLNAGSGAIVHGANLAGEPCDDLAFALPVGDEQIAATDLDADMLRLFGAGLRCLQIAGAMRTVLDMTIAFVKERGQFGRPLGNFQAIQHQVAILASETAAARVSAQIALQSLAGDPDFRAIAAAKIRAGEAAGRAASIAHQVHGAMGFTREYPLHHFVRRLWSWRDAFGSESYWSALLGRRLAQAGGQGLWAELTGI